MLTWTQLWAMLCVLLTSDRIMLRSIQSQMWDIFIPDIPDSAISVEHCLQLRDDVYVKFAGVWLKLSSNEIAEDGWCYATSICSAGVPCRQVWFHLLHWWLSGTSDVLSFMFFVFFAWLHVAELLLNLHHNYNLAKTCQIFFFYCVSCFLSNFLT